MSRVREYKNVGLATVTSAKELNDSQKKILEDNKERYEQMSKRSDEYIKFLQLAHVEQTGAIRESATAAKENAAALKENAQALNRFSLVLEKFSTMIDKIITLKQ